MVEPIDQLIHQNISEWALFNVSIASEAAAEESERTEFGGEAQILKVETHRVETKDNKSADDRTR